MRPSLVHLGSSPLFGIAIVVVACSGSGGGGGGGGGSAAFCIASSNGTACEACLQGACASQLDALSVDCQSFLDCACPGGVFSEAAASQTSCSALASTGTCNTAGNAFATCLDSSCKAACTASSGGSDGGSIAQCADAGLPATLHVTVTGFVQCTCFNGTFTLTQMGSDWVSPPVTGCAGETTTAYVKFSGSQFALGITDQTSSPGSGDSDFAPATSVSCSPLQVTGGGSTAGNINGFCSGGDDQNMRWTVGP